MAAALLSSVVDAVSSQPGLLGVVTTSSDCKDPQVFRYTLASSSQNCKPMTESKLGKCQKDEGDSVYYQESCVSDIWTDFHSRTKWEEAFYSEFYLDETECHGNVSFVMFHPMNVCFLSPGNGYVKIVRNSNNSVSISGYTDEKCSNKSDKHPEQDSHPISADVINNPNGCFGEAKRFIIKPNAASPPSYFLGKSANNATTVDSEDASKPTTANAAAQDTKPQVFVWTLMALSSLSVVFMASF